VQGRQGSALLACVSGILTLGFAADASAQYSMISDPPERYEWRAHAAYDFQTQFETQSDAGDEFDAWRSAIDGGVGGPINQSMLLSFDFRYAHSSFDFNLDNGTPPAYGGTQLPRDPWNTINTLDLVPHMTVLIGDRFSLVTAVPIRWAAETGADRNGFMAGVSAVLRWQVTDDVAVGAGIGVTSQIGRDAETFPIVVLRWRIDENFELATEGDWLQGGAASLYFGPSDTVRLLVSLGYERTRFRLDGYGSAADTDGVGEITSVPLEAGLRLRFAEGAYFDFRAGVGIAGRIRVETPGGNKLYDQRYDTAPRIGLRLYVPFGLPE